MPPAGGQSSHLQDYVGKYGRITPSLTTFYDSRGEHVDRMPQLDSKNSTVAQFTTGLLNASSSPHYLQKNSSRSATGGPGALRDPRGDHRGQEDANRLGEPAEDLMPAARRQQKTNAFYGIHNNKSIKIKDHARLNRTEYGAQPFISLGGTLSTKKTKRGAPQVDPVPRPAPLDGRSQSTMDRQPMVIQNLVPAAGGPPSTITASTRTRAVRPQDRATSNKNNSTAVNIRNALLKQQELELKGASPSKIAGISATICKKNMKSVHIESRPSSRRDRGDGYDCNEAGTNWASSTDLPINVHIAVGAAAGLADAEISEHDTGAVLGQALGDLSRERRVTKRSTQNLGDEEMLMMIKASSKNLGEPASPSHVDGQQQTAAKLAAYSFTENRTLPGIGSGDIN